MPYNYGYKASTVYVAILNKVWIVFELSLFEPLPIDLEKIRATTLGLSGDFSKKVHFYVIVQQLLHACPSNDPDYLLHSNLEYAQSYNQIKYI